MLHEARDLGGRCTADLRCVVQRFVDHARYLDAWFDALALSCVTLVVHDWGSALGFDWANHHRDRIRGIAYMEGIVRPIASWEEWSPSATPIFQGFRSDKGEAMILDRNMFIERVLPGSVLRKLTEAEWYLARAGDPGLGGPAQPGRPPANLADAVWLPLQELLSRLARSGPSA